MSQGSRTLNPATYITPLSTELGSRGGHAAWAGIGRFLKQGREVLSALARAAAFSREASADTLLQSIRALDYSDCSDEELCASLERLRREAGTRSQEGLLPPVFAIVDESIRRRFGPWRLFDPSVECGGLEPYRRLATEVAASADDSTRRTLTESASLDFLSFCTALRPQLRTKQLDEDEWVIVAALTYLRFVGRVRAPWDIALPTSFYRAVANKDRGNVLAFRPTDEQLLAGIHLFRGRVVEMKAGEGKTVAAAFPAVFHALLGRRVHIVTVNDYLAARDLALLGPVYRSLGVSADAVLGHMVAEERRDAYSKSIVYGNLREFGFDFLRDNLKTSLPELVQGPLDVVIVDEADHALVDQAQTPMIISGGEVLNRRAFNRTRKAVSDMIDRQGEEALSLERQLAQVASGSREGVTLLAKLMLSRPDSETLRSRLSRSHQVRRKVLCRVFPDGSDCPDEALTADLYYAVDPERKSVILTDRGQDFLETRLGAFFEGLGPAQVTSRPGNDETTAPARRAEAARLARQLSLRCNVGNQVYQMLRANLLLQKDVDYIVTGSPGPQGNLWSRAGTNQALHSSGGAVVLIDPHTGRTLPDNLYREGLQPALEAREGVRINPERQTLGQVSVPAFINRYRTVAGMTGTASDAADEFRRRYCLEVEMLPSNRPLLRQDLPSRVYATASEKLAAIVDEVEQCRRVGRPALVAAGGIQQSEEISRLLAQREIPHGLLNATTSHMVGWAGSTDEAGWAGSTDEAQIVREAGSFGAVTVATNMAGRGTDIILDADLDQQVTDAYLDYAGRLLSLGASRVTLRCHSEGEAEYLWSRAARHPELVLARLGRQDGQHLLSATGIPAAGGPAECGPSHSLDFGLGLYVIGAQLNACPRIDLQLQGRSGRQGSFGWSRFFLSLEDLMLSDRLHQWVGALSAEQVDSGGRAYIQGKRWESYREQAQVELDREAEFRRNMYQDYADVLDSHSGRYYRERRRVMVSASMLEYCCTIAANVGWLAVERHFPGLDVQNYGARFEGMLAELLEDYGIDCSHLRGVGLDQLATSLESEMVFRIEDYLALLGSRHFSRLARALFLQVGDELWPEHLGEVQQLMLVAGLNGYGHKSAVADYVIEASHRWDEFRAEVDCRFLSRLLTFPVDDGVDSSGDEGRDVRLIPDVAMILAQ